MNWFISSTGIQHTIVQGKLFLLQLLHRKVERGILQAADMQHAIGSIENVYDIK